MTISDSGFRRPFPYARSKDMQKTEAILKQSQSLSPPPFHCAPGVTPASTFREQSPVAQQFHPAAAPFHRIARKGDEPDQRVG